MTTQAGEAIRRIIGHHSMPLVAAFFDPENRFAGATFDTLEPNEPDSFNASDVLATSLLDVPFLPRAVRRILESERTEFEKLLAEVPSDLPLWLANDELLKPAYALWAKLRTLDGVGPTRASKLMARKRPMLLPVMDSVVRTGLGISPQEDSWVLLRDALTADGAALVAEIESLRPVDLDDRVSTLRILDAALWMNLSASTHVTPFRAETARS